MNTAAAKALVAPAALATLATACGAWLATAALPAQAGVTAELRVGVPAWGSVVPVLPGAAVRVVLGAQRHYWYHGGVWFRPRGAQFVVVAPPAAWPGDPAQPDSAHPAPEPDAASPRPEPVFTPQKGQNAQQTEHDLQACNRAAVGDAAALADAVVFQQTVQACMNTRGYAVK